jgi:phage shock protein A
LTLQKIRDLAHDGLTVDEIAPRLEVVTDTNQAENALALLPNVLQEFENIQSQITNQADQLTELTSQVDQLRAQLTELQQRRSWWDRLRRKG